MSANNDNFDIYNIGCNSSLFEHCYRVITSWAAENDCMNNECVFNIRFFEKEKKQEVWP